MRRHLIAASVATVLLLACAGAASAQTPGGLVVQEVDSAGFPRLELLVTVPADMAVPEGEAPDLSVSENGQTAESVEVVPVGGEREPLDIVLVMDTSGSMKGKPLEDAKDAAARFVKSMGGGQDQIAIMGFASRPRVVTGFTSETPRLLEGISSLEASGETALHDALVSASDLIGQRAAGAATVILLSDGGDTLSINTLDNALTSLAASGVTVYAVALESPEFDPGALDAVANRTHGRLISVQDSGTLAGLYEGLARELQTQYRLAYTSFSPRTKELEIDVRASLDGLTAEGGTVIPNPKFDMLEPDDTVRQFQQAILVNPLYLAIAVALVFLATALFVSALVLLLVRQPDSLEQLKYYEQLRRRGSADYGDGQINPLKEKLLEAVSEVAGKRGLTQLVHQRLELAGLPLRPTEYMLLHFLFVVLVGLVAELVTNNLWWGFAGVVLATITPILVLSYLTLRRHNAFEEQLPDILNLISGSLRAGWGIQQSLELVVQEVSPPASHEFRRVQTEALIAILAKSLNMDRKRIRDWAFCHAVLSAWWSLKDGKVWEYGIRCAEIIQQIHL